MTTEVRTLTTGNMWKVLVKPGDSVKEGDDLFIMEVMKMEVPHTAPADGIVSAVHVVEGAEGVEADMIAVELT
jgi:acetyl-CoA carboxylase biotin carboxyl carrier protein